MPCRHHVPSALQAACNAADVIVLLFATDRSDALARIGSHWLPELRRIGVRAPVILVGTKSDTKSADHNLQQVRCMQLTGEQLQLLQSLRQHALHWHALNSDSAVWVTQSAAVLWLQAVVHVMSNFKEIETCLECSAKNLVFVAEVNLHLGMAFPAANTSNSNSSFPTCARHLQEVYML